MKGWSELAPVLDGMDGVRVDVNLPMARLTSFKVGGPLDLLIRVGNEEALAGVLSILERMGCPWFSLGAGTNLLATDEGVEGAAVSLAGDFREVTFSCESGTNVIQAGAGVGLNKVLLDMIEAGFSGLECLTGIPGTVGGAVVMNAGTLHGVIGSSLEKVRVATPAGLEWVDSDRLKMGYRHCHLPEGGVVVAAMLKVMEGRPQSQIDIQKDLEERRRRAHPPMSGTAGSFFKNPDAANGVFAGRLIEDAGLKGAKHGAALSSPQHANFLTNGGGATATEVLELACIIREGVMKDSGHDLEPEVRIIGRNADRWWARLGVGRVARRTMTGPMGSM